MLPGPDPPGPQDPESGRPVALDSLLEGTGASDMVNDLAVSGLPGPGFQILNGCSDLAHLILLGTPSSYITGLSLPLDSPDVVQSLPGIDLTNTVTPMMAVEGGRALPPCEGGVQPGSPPVPSNTVIGPPSRTVCVTTPGTTLTSATPVAPSPVDCLISELHEDSDHLLPGTDPVAQSLPLDCPDVV